MSVSWQDVYKTKEKRLLTTPGTNITRISTGNGRSVIDLLIERLSNDAAVLWTLNEHPEGNSGWLERIQRLRYSSEKHLPKIQNPQTTCKTEHPVTIAKSLSDRYHTL